MSGLAHSQVPGTESPVAELGMRRHEWMLRPYYVKNECCSGFSGWSTAQQFNRKTPDVSACYAVIIVTLTTLIILPCACCVDIAIMHCC